MAYTSFELHFDGSVVVGGPCRAELNLTRLFADDMRCTMDALANVWRRGWLSLLRRRASSIHPRGPQTVDWSAELTFALMYNSAGKWRMRYCKTDFDRIHRSSIGVEIRVLMEFALQCRVGSI